MLSTKKNKTITNNIISKNLKNKSEIEMFGFWVYLMSDCIIFAVLFSIFRNFSENILLSDIDKKNIYNTTFIFVETCILLSSNITYSIVMYYMYQNKKKQIYNWLIGTFLLGFVFLIMGIYELNHLINTNYSPTKNSFLSSFFVLIGVHLLHIFIGLIYTLIIMAKIFIQELTEDNKVKLKCLNLFWHFLEIVWICIFTIVYLVGAIT